MGPNPIKHCSVNNYRVYLQIYLLSCPRLTVVTHNLAMVDKSQFMADIVAMFTL